MTCSNCESRKKLETSKETIKYTGCGLDSLTITLKDVDVSKCQNCGEVYYQYGDLEQLHCQIAKLLVMHKSHFSGAEIRFLRKHMGYSGKMLAQMMGYDPATYYRIEEGQKTSRTFEKFLKNLVLTKNPDREYDSHNVLLKEEDEKIERIEFVRSKKGWQFINLVPSLA